MIFYQIQNGNSQVFDDFSDGDIENNPTWQGDTNSFTVTSEGALQLNAGEESPQSIYTFLDFPDTISWKIDLRMEFSPSGSNQLKNFLVLDGIDKTVASGYYFEIGESGSADEFKFYYLNSGSPELLASLTSSAIQSDPVKLSVEIDRFPDGLWEIRLNPDESFPSFSEAFVNHSEFDFASAKMIEIECHFTSSRKDKFFFDNVSVSKYQQDLTGPIIKGIELLNASSVRLISDEALESVAATDITNYQITGNGYGGSIAEVLLEDARTIVINLSEPLLDGVLYQLTVLGLKDELLNTGIDATFDLFLMSIAKEGDLVVNEVLFNPETGGVDFVEILNISDKAFSLEKIALINSSKNDEKIIGQNYDLLPGKYLCLTSDVSYIKETYQTPDSANFLQVSIPALNNDGGNVSIVNLKTGTVIDAFDYSETYHFQGLDDLNGVSLERINPFSDSQAESNWFSASAAVGFATPGYQNSAFLNATLEGFDLLDFESTTFSPDQDGFEDQLVVKYLFPSTGYLVDIDIYDQKGRHVKKLVNNESLSQSGFVLWDGLSKYNEIANLGIYFVVLEAFNAQGNVLRAKKLIVLAHNLE